MLCFLCICQRLSSQYTHSENLDTGSLPMRVSSEITGLSSLLRSEPNQQNGSGMCREKVTEEVNTNIDEIFVFHLQVRVGSKSPYLRVLNEVLSNTRWKEEKFDHKNNKVLQFYFVHVRKSSCFVAYQDMHAVDATRICLRE
jgi:hypothetical protein